MGDAGSCPLCEPIERKTRWHDVPIEYSDFKCFDCDTCGIPMIVASHHGDWLPGERERGEELAHILFPHLKSFRHMQKLRGHAHFHVIT